MPGALLRRLTPLWPFRDRRLPRQRLLVQQIDRLRDDHRRVAPDAMGQ